jgi:polyisoprenoid-binding protein YceI
VRSVKIRLARERQVWRLRSDGRTEARTCINVFLGRDSLCAAVALVLFCGLGGIGSVEVDASATQAASSAKAVSLAVDAVQSKVNYTLDTTLHTVHGTFALRRGTIRIEPDGKADGEIVADAASGQSGDSGRDKKMHKDVLESAKFTDVVFKPDRVDGKFPANGAVSVQMHGKIGLHGSEHEVTVPVNGEIDGDRWHGKATFKIPYVEWGLKSPSNFFLKADPVVEVEVELAGTISTP